MSMALRDKLNQGGGHQGNKCERLFGSRDIGRIQGLPSSLAACLLADVSTRPHFLQPCQYIRPDSHECDHGL